MLSLVRSPGRGLSGLLVCLASGLLAFWHASLLAFFGPSSGVLRVIFGTSSGIWYFWPPCWPCASDPLLALRFFWLTAGLALLLAHCWPCASSGPLLALRFFWPTAGLALLLAHCWPCASSSGPLLALRFFWPLCVNCSVHISQIGFFCPSPLSIEITTLSVAFAELHLDARYTTCPCLCGFFCPLAPLIWPESHWT
jgi:hypothetical protein